MYNFKTINVVIVSIACVISLAIVGFLIYNESVQNHEKGRWDDTVTITINQKEK